MHRRFNSWIFKTECPQVPRIMGNSIEKFMIIISGTKVITHWNVLEWNLQINSLFLVMEMILLHNIMSSENPFKWSLAKSNVYLLLLISCVWPSSWLTLTSLLPSLTKLCVWHTRSIQKIFLLTWIVTSSFFFYSLYPSSQRERLHV